jgi:hypothetical protein
MLIDAKSDKFQGKWNTFKKTKSDFIQGNLLYF